MSIDRSFKKTNGHISERGLERTVEWREGGILLSWNAWGCLKVIRKAPVQGERLKLQEGEQPGIKLKGGREDGL